MPFINPTINQTTNENLFDKSSIISTIVDANLWQLHNKYIFIQTESGLLAIDQHNAHERSIYEKLVRQVKAGGTDKQMLLFPISAKLSSMQVITLKELQSYFKTTGFDFEIGNVSVTIYSQPCNLKISDVGNFFIHIVDDYLENEELKYIPSKQDKILATIACKAAIKAGQALSQDEMQKIVLDLMECEMPNVCPHGRPIIVESSLLEWDKRFGRI
jgi:DNA mismatch repair protein MutL